MVFLTETPSPLSGPGPPSAPIVCDGGSVARNESLRDSLRFVARATGHQQKAVDRRQQAEDRDEKNNASWARSAHWLLLDALCPLPTVYCPLPGERDGKMSRFWLRFVARYDSAMDPDTLTLRQFQKHVSDRYEQADRARGTPGTWLHFSEEIGELARALARNNDRANLEEEFADVIAWLCTLANINDVDLAGAIAKKYLSESAPKGTK